jgi:hypothetical protein
MMTFPEPVSVPSDRPVPRSDQLRLAVAAYLARFKGSSRYHTESDLRCYLSWCSQHRLDPWLRGDRTWSCRSRWSAAWTWWHMCVRQPGAGTRPVRDGPRSGRGHTWRLSAAGPC